MIGNIDDDNQYVNYFPSWYIIKSPNLTLIDGKLPVLKGPGLALKLIRVPSKKPPAFSGINRKFRAYPRNKVIFCCNSA